MSAAPQLLVIGSLNTDLLVRVGELPGPGETVTGGVFEMSGGGKGANQAVAAARAGASVAMVGAVGTDEFGARLLEELAAEGVSVAGVARLPGVATGLAAIVVDEEGENQIAVASGANHALRASDVERAFGELDLSRARCALLSLEVDDEVVVEGAGRAAARGMAVVVNPAPARPLPPELVALRPILTPNEGEAAELTGRDDPADGGRGDGGVRRRRGAGDGRSERRVRRDRGDASSGSSAHGVRCGTPLEPATRSAACLRPGWRAAGSSTGRPAGRRPRRRCRSRSRAPAAACRRRAR